MSRKIKPSATKNANHKSATLKPEAAPSRGAVHSQNSAGQKFKSWRQHHVISAKTSLMRLLGMPLQTIMTSLVVAIALALPTTLFIAINNVQTLGDSWDANPKISVYLHLRAREAAIKGLEKELTQRTDIKSVEYISPAEALAGFQDMAGFGNALDMLEQNPLPPTLVVTPTAAASSPALLAALGDSIRKNSLVESVDMDMDWVRRLREIMVLGKKIVTILASLLGLGVLLALGNSIRLAIENRRDEIIIVKLVGGTNGFVRRPFLYTGAWYGFFGGTLAVLLVSLGHQSLAGSVASLAAAYQSGFVLKGLTFMDNFSLLAASTFLGLFSAWLAVGKHLSEIEPR
ncbi:permease-like cell division protein FtsX [Marinagarivorans cellulosilyticus]|uniref:Cell division protein FtsX n=1 Tax=Marinagarivorans cellulosilyticus TaxID=2721545 RepID=A0AAN1WLA7_9GAMM|nr:permease-like cell division protein FtsX [Marinagarivorans cellulosilyticus]BCD99741.1 cell division transport system permease protein [Marinagarivorans cellulosilyticus]